MASHRDDHGLIPDQGGLPSGRIHGVDACPGMGRAPSSITGTIPPSSPRRIRAASAIHPRPPADRRGEKKAS